MSNKRTIQALLQEIEQLKTRVAYLETLCDEKEEQIAFSADESRFSQLLETLPITVFIYQNRRVVYLNPTGRTLGGHNLPEIIRKDFWSLIHPESTESLKNVFRTFNQQENYQSRIEIRAYDIEGQLRSLDVIFASIEYKNKPALLGAVIDVTERLRAHEQLVALDAEKERVKVLTDFVRDVSHDFRTPLSTINTSIYLLGRVDDPIKRQQQLNTLRDQVKHLDKLVDALLTMSRLDSGLLAVFKPFDLNLLVIEAIQSLSTHITEKQHTVLTELDDNLPQLWGDIHEIHRALRELVMNAVQYTQQRGEITLRTYQDADMVVIVIQDNGYGISLKDMPYIFDRFFRADQARAIGGVGLGLSIVRKVVEHHQGEIIIESVPQHGTQFVIRLPITHIN
ncbi:MAG: ATP-binding protein [Phototrophicales bacterium]|nr:ATP-binding protein [Phototrophicales bacterium]